MATDHLVCVKTRDAYSVHVWMVVLLVLAGVVTSQRQYFITQPRDTFVLPGESASLYCQVGSKTGIIFWEKDSMVFARSEGPVNGFSGMTPWATFGNSSLGEFNLQLLKVIPGDQGRYVCKVTSPAGPLVNNLTSTPSMLRVLDFPTDDFPLCVMSIRDALTEDDVVELTCAFLNNSTAQPTLTWERRGTPTDFSNTKQSSRDGYVLKRHTVTLSAEDDMSSYQCVMSAPGMTSRSCTTGILNVTYRPVVTISPSSLSAKTGDDARFTCSLVAANPSEVTYEWYYRGAAVTLFSSGIDFIQTPEGNSQIRIEKLANPTGGVPVVCVATNEVGSTRVEAFISLEEPVLVTISSEELFLWLVPLSVVVTVVVFLIFLAIMSLDCCPCCWTFCNKRRHKHQSPDRRSLNSTWSAAENFGMSPSSFGRRLSDADSTDFYVTRAIKTSGSDTDGPYNVSSHVAPVEGRPRSNHSIPPPVYRTEYPSNYRTPSPTNYHLNQEPRTRSRNNRSRSPSPYYLPTPDDRARLNADEPTLPDNGHLYEQNRSRPDRNRGHTHYRRGGNTAANGNVQPGTGGAPNRSATRSSALSDSGLDFNASSSVDSRSPTPRDERVVYAKIIRNNSADSENRERPSRLANGSPEPRPVGTPLPTSSTSRPRSTLEVPIDGMHRAHSMEIPTS